MTETTSGTTPGTTSGRQAPPYARFVRATLQRLVYDVGGGPRLVKFGTVINFQKALMFPYRGALMWLYRDVPAATSTAAWIYLGLHGSYGLTWYLKDKAFGDPAWAPRITLVGALNSILMVLGWYWVFGWLLISGHTTMNYPLPDKPWFAVCITLVMFGAVVMIAADAQKFFTLRLQRGLITDGMFRYIRHPNYTGEMMIYGGLALLVWHWLPFVVVAWVWGGLFTANMMTKEASMSRYPEWAAYKKRTTWVIPFVL